MPLETGAQRASRKATPAARPIFTVTRIIAIIDNGRLDKHTMRAM